MEKEEQMSDNLPVDISKWVETTLLGLFLLIGRSFRTFFDFVVHPYSVADSLNSADPLDDSYSTKHTRPLSYLFIAIIALMGGFILLADNENLSPYIQNIATSLQNADLMGFMIRTSPFIVFAGIYAFCITLVSRIKEDSLSFAESLYISSYFLGTLFIIICSVLTGQSLFILSETWGILIGAILFFAVIIRSYFGLLVLIKCSMNATLKTAFGILVGSSILIIFFWIIGFYLGATLIS